MMATGVVLAALALAAQSAGFSGALPAGFDSAARISWVAAEDETTSECTLPTPGRWTCASVPPGASGVIVMFGSRSIGYALVSTRGVFETGVADWGRLVRVAAGAVGPEDLRGLKLSAWTPDRPAVRPQTRKLGLVGDGSLRIWQLSDTAFWMAGPLASPESLLRVEGAAIASHYVPMTVLMGGSPDSPFVIDAAIPRTIGGRVESTSRQAVAHAHVELFAPAAGDAAMPQDDQSLERATVLRLETTETDDDGSFEFARLGTGAYQVVAVDFALGRAERWTSASSAPVVITLAPSATVTGRVLRRKLPAPNVRVRFVPDPSVWQASVDPSAHLTAESTTDEFGRFIMSLPPVREGIVQFIAPDGAAVRITLPGSPKASEIVVGDVTLPDLISVEVRSDTPGCQLSAAGPIGGLGLAIVQARGAENVYRFDFPEAGQWFLEADCSGEHRHIEPQAITIPDAGPLPTIDIRVVKPEPLNPRPQ